MTALPRALIAKEGRALAPIWLGAVVTIVAATQAGMLSIALLAFIVGAAALGVFSIGHEYTHRTLTSFLTQPLTRSRLLLSKVVVLAPLLFLLSFLVVLVLLQADGVDRMFGRTAEARAWGALIAPPVDAALVSRWQVALVVLTPLLGLCVAPWLTMVCRNVMAGLVFTLAIPAALWIGGQIARAASVDFDFVELEISHPFAYEPALVLMTVGVVALSVVAFVHGRAMFVGLEALETPRELVPFRLTSSWRRTAAVTTRRRHPLLVLVHKEVRLHTIAFAVAALYALGWIALSAARAEQTIASQSFSMLTAMYGGFIAVLLGAVSVAEERSLGTAQWQMLQPLAVWRQLLLKLTTISVLALLLGLALPVGLDAAFPLMVDSERVGPRLPLYLWFPLDAARGPSATIVLITLFSAYASTLCIGGLRALLVALSLGFGLASLYSNLFNATYNLQLVTHSFSIGTIRVRFLWSEDWIRVADTGDLWMASRLAGWISAAMFAAFVGGLLYLYFRNARSAEPGLTLARKQIPWLAVYVGLAAVLAVGSDAFFQWWFLTH